MTLPQTSSPSGGACDDKAFVPSSLPCDSWFTSRKVTLLLLLLLCTSFTKVVLGLHSFFYRDYGVLGYPFIYHFRESVWSGTLPVWNPLSNCGAPFLAQWGTMVFYPFSLFYVLFPMPWSLSYFCLGHLLLGGAGMYQLGRRWSGSPFGAAVAAVLYLFNGVTFSCLLWPNYAVALGWMPWVVLLAERSWREGGARRLVSTALVAAFQLLSGVPELVLLTWLFLGVCLGRDLVRSPALRYRGVARFLGVVLLVTGLAAVQLLPFLDLLAHSQRDASFTSSKWPMPGWGWANLLVPLFHNFQTPQGPFFQYGQEFLSSYYLGGAALVLAVWATWRNRDGRVWILGGALLLSFILALGENAFVFTWFKTIFPLAGMARYPIKFVILSAFAVPLLVAFAVARLQADAVLSSKLPRSLLLCGGVALLLIVFLLWFAHAHPFPYDQWEPTLKSGLSRAALLVTILGLLLWLCRRRPTSLTPYLALLALLYVDARTHTANQNPTLPNDVFATGLWQLKNENLDAPQHGISRAFITPQAELRLLNSAQTNLHVEFLTKRLALWSNLNLLEEIPKINGSSTLQIREQMILQKRLYAATNRPPTGLLNFLGAAIASDARDSTEWVSRTNSLPLLTVGQQPVFMEPDPILEAVLDPDFDGRKVVYLSPAARGFVAVTNPSATTIISQKVTPRRIAAVIESGAPALLVIAQSYYHPWRAEVDGRPTPVLRANYAFQAIALPAGRHEVELAYRDVRLRWGMLITALTALGCLGACLLPNR